MPEKPAKPSPLPPRPLATPPAERSQPSRFSNTRLIRIHLAEATGRKIQDILDSISDAFLAVNQDWNIEYANPSYLRLFAPEHTSIKELIGRSLWELSPGLADSEAGQRYRTAMETQVPDFFEILHKPTETWLGVRIHPSPEMLSIYATDITEKRLAEQSIRRLAAIVESSDDAIISKNLEGVITSWNRGAERIYGYRADEVIGRSITILIPEDRADEEPQILDRVRRGERIDHYETLRLRKDGELIHVALTVSPIRNSKGVVIGASKIARDISQRKTHEAALKEAKETAEAANAAKDRFLAVLSHELRTPLTPVLMSAAAMEADPATPPKIREQMAMIRRNVELETKLIDDLLDLSRIANGKLTLNLEPVDLKEIVRQVCAICQTEISAKGVHLHQKFTSPPPLVRADAARLQQVIWNVLKNAIKFTSNGGNIFVEISRIPTGWLELTVRDTGVGLDREILPHIFNAFEQGDARMTRQFGGLGLGLAICRALLTLHEGTIEAESDGPQKGATFRITLKEVLPEEVVHPERPLAAVAPGASPLRLLLVEDHADTASTLGRLLTDSGYLVKTASSAEAAIEFVGTSPIDLLISDIGLPDLSGHELLRRIRAHRPIKAIAISGYGMDDDIRRSLEAGFLDHLTKPVNLTALEQAIRRAME